MGIARQVWLFCRDLLPYVLVEGVTMYAHALLRLTSLSEHFHQHSQRLQSRSQTEKNKMLQSRSLIKHILELK